ncbi:MAG: ABC transporter ATP-binding protein [Magnetovibrio sp.]|nr:ABC transporter ATP-binding protein [Magnetovibrio sp.]|tara:strand:+ start:612 stop:1373 length:762 start_codon:yes stop_codon:yes gene_type:complete
MQNLAAQNLKTKVKVPLLNLENVVTHYGSINILKDVNLDVFPGEVVSLLGGNASGKTTTMKTILGLVKPTSGSIHFDGHRIDSLSTGEIIAMGLAPVPEARRLFPTMTVRENLLMGAYVHRHEKNNRTQEEFHKVLELFPPIRDRLEQVGGTLSGGEQQMVALGRALMARPKMILMDEPSMGLAPALVEKVYEIIREIAERGTTMFIVEQNANMALSVANRGYVLQNGEIVINDTAKNILQSERIRKAYLGEA